jgi:putative ABC transport system permease protein
VRQEHLRSEDSPNLYVPYRQYFSRNVFLIFKSTRPDLVSGSQIAKLVHAVDLDQPLDDVATMETRLADSITADRVNMELMGISAGVALALAGIGIFGVIAYLVSRRTHEIGVRMALGAQRRDVLWLVLRPGMVMTIIGIGLGLLGAFAFTRVLRSSLYGVGPNDPLTLAAVSVVFFFVAFAACYIPARRAAQVDPMVALRYE